MLCQIFFGRNKTYFIYFFIFEDGGWEEEDEFSVDKLLLPWSYE